MTCSGISSQDLDAINEEIVSRICGDKLPVNGHCGRARSYCCAIENIKCRIDDESGRSDSDGLVLGEDCLG